MSTRTILTCETCGKKIKAAKRAAHDGHTVMHGALKNFEKARGGEDTQSETQISNSDATTATTDAQKL